MSDEKRLIKSLLEQYKEVGVVGRPVLNHSEMIKVYYGLSLIQILDLDEKNQVLQTNVWSRYVSRFTIFSKNHDILDIFLILSKFRYFPHYQIFTSV